MEKLDRKILNSFYELLCGDQISIDLAFNLLKAYNCSRYELIKQIWDELKVKDDEYDYRLIFGDRYELISSTRMYLVHTIQAGGVLYQDTEFDMLNEVTNSLIHGWYLASLPF